jgi:predicted DNA-binding transcriptional regulator AlpA
MSHQEPRSTQRPARSYPRPAAPEEMQPLYLRVPQILRRYGIGRSTFYRMVKEGLLPPPIHPTGSRLSAWSASALDEAFESLHGKH